ncbi:MAG: hypothetical protein HY928_04520, partial [Elusimicrobia bacterium]|nr:hypothetical protein [Elusimicrobiota bacterium]
MDPKGPKLRVFLAAGLLLVPQASPFAQTLRARNLGTRPPLAAPLAVVGSPAAAFDGFRSAIPAPRALKAAPALPPGAPVGHAALLTYEDAAREAAGRGAEGEARQWSQLSGLRAAWSADSGPEREAAGQAAARIAGLLRRGLYGEVSRGLDAAAEPPVEVRRRQSGALVLLGPAVGADGALRGWVRENLEPEARRRDDARKALAALRILLGRSVDLDEESARTEALEAAEQAQGVLARRGTPAKSAAAVAVAHPAAFAAAAPMASEAALPRDSARSPTSSIDAEFSSARSLADHYAARVALARRGLDAAAGPAWDGAVRKELEDGLSRDLEALREARDRLYLLGKLSQRSALGGAGASAEADAVLELARRYDAVLGSRGGSPLFVEDGEAESAAAEALRRRLSELLAAERRPEPPSDAPMAGTPLERSVTERLDRLAQLEARAQAELAQRDAAGQMLALADRLRGGALRERRAGREQLEFRKNFSRLAMVMDLSYSLNVITAAEKAIAGMQALLDEKLTSVEERRRLSDAAQEAARRAGQRREEWDKAVRDKVAADEENVGLFTRLGAQAGRISARLARYRADVKGLLGFIDARDRGPSASALSEYERRLALLPALQEWRRHGYPSGGDSVSKLSLDRLRSERARLGGYLAQVADGEQRLADVPLEFAGVLVVAVPGVPSVSVSNPDAATALRILSERRDFWRAQKDDFAKLLSGVDDLLGGGSAVETDDFGDPVPVSAVAYRAQERRKLDAARAEAERFARDLDAVARVLAQAGAPGLPPLSGLDPAALRAALPDYADRLQALTLPPGDGATDAKIDKIDAARLLPFLGDAVARAAEAEAKVKALDDAIARVLPAARTKFAAAVAGTEALLADVSADEGYVRSGFPAGAAQALIDRKKALLSRTLKPMLQGLDELLEGTLIPYQLESIESASPTAAGEGYAVLYKEKKNLFERIRNSYENTMPWSLAANGAPEGDAAAGRAGVEEQRRSFSEYRQLVADYLDEIRRRKDPATPGMEEVYGESMPFSLPTRIAQYRQETVRRAGEINAIGAEVNAILAEIDGLTGGRHNLAAGYRLPTDIRAPDAGSAARVKALADAKTIQNLASVLKSVSDAAMAAGSDGGLGVGSGDGGIPTGSQPSPQLSNEQRTAVLALDAVKRLVPSSLTAGGASLTEAMARYLFSDGVAEASRESLEEQIPVFEAFLRRAEGTLDAVFADLDQDAAYVGGRGETGEAVFSRKERIYARVQETAAEGAALFGQKVGWDKGSFDTVASIADYYATLEEIYARSDEALDAEVSAAQTYRDTLKKTADDLAAQRGQVTEWLRQLNDPHETAMRRVADNLSRLQERTRAVLESNIKQHDAKKSYDAAAAALQATLKALEAERGALSDALHGVDLGDLSEGVARRVESVGLGGSAWLAAGPRGRGALVVKKSEFASFLSALFGSFAPDASARDIVRLRTELLKNPMALAQLLPNSRMLELGDDPNGFYLVYDSAFSTPHGLETSSQVTLGNVLRLWDSNVSVTGHRFVSPPSAGNAPFGDQGVTVSVESLEGENWVNYLDVTLHKFIQDIPSDITPSGQAREARMMVFDDFALMLNGDKLYFGAAGFADFALTGGKDKPYYYGGNVKTSIKFTEIMRLNAEETRLYAKDPRKFLQTINLDFTKFDPALDRDFVVDAHGDDREFRRDRVGVGLDIGRALDQADSFTVDFFVERVRGTDDIPNDAFGATIVKGISFEVGGVPVRTTLSGTGTIGSQYDTVSARASFELPNQGIVLSASGKKLGDGEAYLLELRKRFGDNTEAYLSYGSPYLGLNRRLTIGANTSFTLGQLWRAVAGRTGEDLMGGQALEAFNKDLEEFFKRDDASNPLVAELARVFDADVGKRLISLEIGRLSRELGELRRAGAFLDNTRMKGMVGFVTNPVGENTADRAAGGGFQVGTETELSLTKTQKALIQSRAASLYAAGLSLQTRLLELTRLWQESVAELLEARWEAELGLFMAANAPDEVLAKEGQAKVVEAQGRYHQAQLKYNMLTGRSPDAAIPFAEANPNDLDYLFLTLGKALEKPGRLGQLLARLGPSGLPSQEPGFNLLDWVPWVEKLTFWVGAQLHDILANQVLGAGVSIRLPIYDPNGPTRDKAFLLESEAVAQEMLASYRELRLRAQHERLQTVSYDSQISRLAAEGPVAAAAVADAVRAYRNGLMGQDELWAVFRRWHWTVSRLVDARARASLSAAWALLDDSVAASGPEERAAAGAAPVRGLDEALDLAAGRSASLESLARRSQAAAELLEAAGRRVEKVAVDVNLGVNVTADGVAWIPALGLTGFGVYPIVSVRFKPEELRQLETDRRSGEAALYGHMRGALEADLAGQLFASYSALRSADEALAVLESDLLPAARLAAGSGGSDARRRLLELETRFEALSGERAQLAATINHLLGRAPAGPVEWGQDSEAALAALKARSSALAGTAARRGVLAERVRVARAVETIVDKNLRLQDLRIEPVSLIGRSLGRLVAALSGSGDSSPELVALARQQVLEAEADQRAFEKGLLSSRARLGYELFAARRILADLSRRGDAESRFQAALLRGRLLSAEAQLALLGGADAGAPAPAPSPRAWGELEERLAAALRAETPVPGLGGGDGYVPEPTRWSATGALRYFDARQSIGKDPIGKRFIEGWVEVRLGSRTTPPEALLALAALPEERAARIFDAAPARAESRAKSLLARLRLDAGLLRWARGGSDGSARAALAERLAASLEAGLAEVSAHLGLGAPLGLEDFLAFVPLSEAESPAEAAEAFRARVDGLGLEALRRSVFSEGLPAGLEGARDSLSQLKADLVASRMSYKGFTPVGAFGLFRGRWVAGAFLEAPDPEAVRDTLEGILADALRQELESQDRLKELSLRLHGLMAAVADGSRLVEAQGQRLQAAEGNLAGVLVRLERGMASAEEAAAARAEAGAALEAFLDSLVTVRSDFVRLVAELKALGQASFASGGAPTRRMRGVEARGRALDELAAWTAGRMADADFAARLASLFDGRGLASGRDLAELQELSGWYRRMLADADAVRHHSDFDPAQRLDLLVRADVEGRRLLIERRLKEMLSGVTGGSEPGWDALRAFLRAELEKDAAASGAEADSRRGLATELRRAAAGALAPALGEAAAGLITRRSAMEAAREALLAGYLSSDQSPEDFLLKDALLDEYLKALTAYDETVVAAFASEAVRKDPAGAQALDGMFSLKESAERRAAYLRRGRGLLAVEALLAVENTRLEVLRKRRSGPEALALVSRRIAELEATRGRWLARPAEVDSVSAVLDGRGGVERWVTRRD